VVGWFFKSLGVAALVLASLNATTGLCFCHRGPDAPIPRPGHSCCHPADDDDVLALRAVGTCCHIEAAQRDMTPADAAQLAAPVAGIIVVLDLGDEAIPLRSLSSTPTPSPPVQVLRL
jgi:hypothetical protein